MSEFIDFIFSINGEKHKGYGEDACVAEIDENKALLGVFDGCGGVGSRKYAEHNNMTGAYIASRKVRDVVEKRFKNCEKVGSNTLKADILKELRTLSDAESGLKGDMQRAFPTTMSVIDLKCEKRYVSAEFLWAGDSRGYLLDDKGFAQITRDDISGGGDAFENLTEDARLSNYICADGEFTINRRGAKLTHPCVIISATDGCFGYFNTPMEFEYMLTESLMKSENEIEWKNALEDEIKSISGDDYSLCLCSIGFKSFKKLKKALKKRNRHLEKEYIYPMEKGMDFKELWEEYKEEYYV
jgi:hypothetical protein